MMHRYATALLLFTLPAQAHEHPKDFAGGNGEWFDQLERPDNAQHPERYRTGGGHLCCTDKDATAVQTKYQIPEGGSYPEAVYRVWKLVGAIIIIGNSACGGGNWIIDANGAGGLGNRERAMAAVPLSRNADRRAIAPERLPGDVGGSQPPALLPPQAGLKRISHPRLR
jgi:hypothetical protein